MKTNETEKWKLRAELAETNCELWRKEAELWRNLYIQYDQMLDADLTAAQSKISKITSEIDKIKKMNKGY